MRPGLRAAWTRSEHHRRARSARRATLRTGLLFSRRQPQTSARLNIFESWPSVLLVAPGPPLTSSPPLPPSRLRLVRFDVMPSRACCADANARRRSVLTALRSSDQLATTLVGNMTNSRCMLSNLILVKTKTYAMLRNPTKWPGSPQNPETATSCGFDSHRPHQSVDDGQSA